MIYDVFRYLTDGPPCARAMPGKGKYERRWHIDISSVEDLREICRETQKPILLIWSDFWPETGSIGPEDRQIEIFDDEAYGEIETLRAENKRLRIENAKLKSSVLKQQALFSGGDLS